MASHPRNTAEIGSWQLDGNGPEAYERHLVPKFFHPWAEALVDRVAPGPGDRVLDLCCGTGVVARAAASRLGPEGSVTGVDLNEAMLATAREAYSRAGIETPAEWHTGDASELPFLDGSFDLVLCQQALQFMPAPAKLVREARRVLGGGGRLGLNVLRPIGRNPTYAILADVLERHAGAEAGGMMRAPFPDWNAESLRDLVLGEGFGEVRIHLDIRGVRFPSPAEYLRQEASSSPLAGPIAALPPDTRAAMLDDLQRSLSDYADDEGLAFPMETHLVVAS